MPATSAAIRHAVRRSAEFDVVVACNLVWRGPPSSHQIIRRLVRAGRKVVVVSNNNYDERFLPEAKTLLVTYSAMPPSMDVAAAALFGKLKAVGVSPLQQ